MTILSQDTSTFSLSKNRKTISKEISTFPTTFPTTNLHEGLEILCPFGNLEINEL